ncbi:MAG: Oxidoreductase domain protein [Candidatus Woesebacteria bacterium GW2011_GWB1_38_5b]|uniref:Oxidoreductase domain protein n=1 Tax=Candidatus Woesebacteria bacterium GW2011_GWB1_38_5b TaxID=1618569 RepID=A0A0G0MPY9_9BACT|nr:MAG: Oxidoreductase domain protein [Candidatus Woesebacteria bacterium GW2011_GWB1_38_5b]
MIKLALIGKGKWGQNYIKTIRGIRDVSLLKSNILGKDYLNFLSKLDADGVIIATPVSAHFQVAKDVVKSGFKKLLIEKPLTRTFSEALLLRKLAKKHSVLIMVGHIQLYDEAIIKMEEKLSLVGTIREMSYEGLKSPIRTDGTTVIQDWGPHPSYLFLHFASRFPKNLTGERGREDNILLRYNFGNVVATAKIGWTYPKRRRFFKISGDKGKLIFDGSLDVKKLTFIDNNGNKKFVKFPHSISPLKTEILEFVNMIKKRSVPKTTLSQGLEVMKIIDFAEKSLVEQPKQL